MAREALIENAILNAKNKANIIAKASEIKLKEIIKINYSFTDIFFHSNTIMEYNNIDMGSEASFPDINPSEINLTSRCNISRYYKMQRIWNGQLYFKAYFRKFIVQ